MNLVVLWATWTSVKLSTGSGSHSPQSLSSTVLLPSSLPSHSKLTVHRYIRMETGILSARPSRSLWKTLSSSSTLQPTSESDPGLSPRLHLHSWKQFAAARTLRLVARMLLWNVLSAKHWFSIWCPLLSPWGMLLSVQGDPHSCLKCSDPPVHESVQTCAVWWKIHDFWNPWQWCSLYRINRIVHKPQNLSISLTDGCK
jgi:hypothetical protein